MNGKSVINEQKKLLIVKTKAPIKRWKINVFESNFLAIEACLSVKSHKYHQIFKSKKFFSEISKYRKVNSIKLLRDDFRAGFIGRRKLNKILLSNLF